MAPKRRRPQTAQKAPDRGTDSSSGEDEEHEAGGQHRQRKRNKAARAGIVSTFFGGGTGGSHRSVADLHLAGVDETSLQNTIAGLPERLPNEKNALRARHAQEFGRWWAQWRAGHSLLFYGFGSKHALLQKFARACCGDGACLTINGLHPGLTARQVLMRVAALAKLSKAQHYRATPVKDLLDLIRSEAPLRKIYVVLHNIDGPGLRDLGSQRLLSEMSALPNVHLAASVDHVNAPLLWDLQTKDRFGWLWHHVPTFQPYVNEVVAAAVPSLLVGRR